MRGPVPDRRRAPGRWRFPGAVALALLVLAAPEATAGVAVRALAVSATADAGRLVIDLAASTRASVFALDRPDRVVIDLKSAAFDRRAVKVPPGSGLIRRVRVAPREGGTLRIVLELEHGATLRLLPETVNGDGRRLVLELGVAFAERAVAQTAPALPVVERSTPPPTRDLVIAVDAGHGGDDPGATGRDGTREKDVTLAVARVLAARINAEPGMRAVLTRNADVFVKLDLRVKRARDAHADLFVSVHADAVSDRSVTGSSVYVLSPRGASSLAAKWLADHENAADLMGGVSLDDKDNVLASVLLDLSQSAAMSASMVAAAKVLDELNDVGEVRKQRVQQAGFVVLKSPDIPSMLIESAYITNPGEERRLRDPRHQSRLADAILSGIRNYFRENPPPGTRMAALAAASPGERGDAMGPPSRSLQR